MSTGYVRLCSVDQWKTKSVGAIYFEFAREIPIFLYAHCATCESEWFYFDKNSIPTDEPRIR